jgi:hypothetical protein
MNNNNNNKENKKSKKIKKQEQEKSAIIPIIVGEKRKILESELELDLVKNITLGHTKFKGPMLKFEMRVYFTNETGFKSTFIVINRKDLSSGGKSYGLVHINPETYEIQKIYTLHRVDVSSSKTINTMKCSSCKEIHFQWEEPKLPVTMLGVDNINWIDPFRLPLKAGIESNETIIEIDMQIIPEHSYYDEE